MTRDETKRMYGMAILMMFCLHLFRNADAASYFSILNLVCQNNILMYVANFGGICVAMYAFISGYGFSEYAKRKAYLYQKSDIREIGTYVIKHIFNLYKKYWIVYLIFVPLGYLTCSYDAFSPKVFILSLLGLDYSYCGAWWYVWQYVILCAVFPVQMILLDTISALWERNGRKINFVNAGMTFVLFAGVLFLLWAAVGFKTGAVLYGIICFLGFISSRYSIISNGRRALNKLTYSNLFCAIVLIAIAILRGYQQTVYGTANGLVDILIIIPFFTCACKLMEQAKLAPFLTHIGEMSTYMWLIHDFFLTTNLSIVVKVMKPAILKYLVLIVISYLCSKIVTMLEKKWNAWSVAQRGIDCL